MSQALEWDLILNAGDLSNGTALIVGMFDPNMNQTYGFAWAGENQPFFRMVTFKK